MRNDLTCKDSSPNRFWVATQNITTHWLRHTTLTWVERTFGYTTARAYAGHHTHTSGTTATDVKSKQP
ncbi:hypothetical protein [Nocardia sp. NPDC004604]|uniref:hypothetical protein n=1 Tax=Nocardia sp. NPDC004604 TaxID=3157013 RepID=UPI0033B23653